MKKHLSFQQAVATATFCRSAADTEKPSPIQKWRIQVLDSSYQSIPIDTSFFPSPILHRTLETQLHKMNKRANEDAQSEQELSAKRSITSEQQHALRLKEAQDALDRLD